MLKPVLVAVFLTGLLTPVAAAAPSSTCLEPPTADKNELCVELLPSEGKEFAAQGRFAPADSAVPATLRVVVEQRLRMWPSPFVIAEGTATGTGELSVVTAPGASHQDADTVRACAHGWTDIGAHRYEVCTPWRSA